jgi:hypothetical protein
LPRRAARRLHLRDIHFSGIAAELHGQEYFAPVPSNSATTALLIAQTETCHDTRPLRRMQRWRSSAFHAGHGAPHCPARYRQCPQTKPERPPGLQGLPIIARSGRCRIRRVGKRKISRSTPADPFTPAKPALVSQRVRNSRSTEKEWRYRAGSQRINALDGGGPGAARCRMRPPRWEP